jgi:putative endopeptidase
MRSVSESTLARRISEIPSPFMSGNVQRIRIHFVMVTNVPFTKTLFFQATLAILLLSALFVSAQNTPATSIKPGDDFYRYANGRWLATATIPAGHATYDNRAMINETTALRVRDLIRGAASSHSAKVSITQQVGDYYASFMDRSTIDAKGMAPLADEMAAITAIANKTELSAYLGTTLNSEVDGLTANADHIFGMWVNQGFEDADHNLPHIWQGGLGLPDRDNYLDASSKMAELRTQYQAHIAAVLKLAGIADSETKAARVMALETQIAQAFAPDSDASDVSKQNNPWKRSDFSAKAPGLDWDSYFKSAGLAGQTDFIVWQPSAVIGVSKLVATQDIATWQDYLRFHLVEHYSIVLPAGLRDEHFAFYGKTLSGAQQPTDPEKDAIAATNAALGQAVGQLYTQRYFPPEEKAAAQTMAANLITAFRGRIANLTWMTPPTKKKALEKLDAFKLFIGYPDSWIDYSNLETKRADAFGNMRRAEAFNRSRNLEQLKQPVFPMQWPINAQIPGAVIMFSPNAEFFSAGILQSPYFDSNGDAASNYGSAGAGMAHEISHSFDELGNIYDAQGRIAEWWTAEDRAQYHAAAAKLVSQMNAYCPLANLCVNGKQVQTESIADLAGLLVAHDAYILSLKGTPDATINGLSGEQRFFLAYAQRWRKIQDEASLRNQLATDTHPPGEYRADTVRNIDAWYKAFSVSPGDKLYLNPEDRVSIW